MVDVMWIYPELICDFIPRLMGMHLLMSFVGCVGVLMANSGLEQGLKAAFGGVARMLTGNNNPQTHKSPEVSHRRVLRDVIQDIDSHDELMDVLEDRAISTSPPGPCPYRIHVVLVTTSHFTSQVCGA
jgi:hypothetical protein